jgi:hypothetical protein
MKYPQTLQINLQRRDSSRFEHTGQNREASSLAQFPAGICAFVLAAPVASVFAEGCPSVTTITPAAICCTPCFTAAPFIA